MSGWRAMTTKSSAIVPLVHQSFSPFEDVVALGACASRVVARFAGSEPTCGSVSANAEIAPAAQRGRYFFFCSSVPKSFSGCGHADRLVRREQRDEVAVAARDQLHRLAVLALREAEAAVLLRDLHAEGAELRQPLRRPAAGSCPRGRSRPGRPPPRGSARACRMKCAELGALRRRRRKRMDEVEAEVAEEDLLQEGRRLPLGLAGLLGDPAGLVGADGLGVRLGHGARDFTTGRDGPRGAPSIVGGGRDEQVPLLRRRARPEGAGDVLAPRLAVRPRQRHHELRPAPPVEAPDRATWRSARGRPSRPRVLDLCCGSGDLCFLAEERGAGAVVGRGLHAADAGRRAAAARARTAAAARFVQADALRLPFPDGAVRRRHGRLRPAQHRRHLAAALRRCGACSRRAAGPSSSTSASRTTAVAAALYRAFLHTMMPAVGWLFHGDPETYLYIPESLERFPASAASSA